MDERFSDRLRRIVDPLWSAQETHPFVLGIGDGTLETERFAHWVRQDYLFLIDYCRLVALAAARAPDLDTMTWFSGLLQATLTTEMDLHRRTAAELNITNNELEREVASPTTRGYADFLLRTAALGDYFELVAALTPCMWGYSELGQSLARRPRPSHAIYAAWIDTYADPAFAELATWCRSLLDRLAVGASVERRQAAEDAFVTSSRFELAFWEAVYRQETWSSS